MADELLNSVKDGLHAAMLQVKADLKLAGVIPGHWDRLCDAVDAMRAELAAERDALFEESKAHTLLTQDYEALFAENAAERERNARLVEALRPFPYMTLNHLASILENIKVAGWSDLHAGALGYTIGLLRRLENVRAAAPEAKK